MPYENNTYISDKGRELTRTVFHNLFKNDGEKMDVGSASSIVDHFRGPDGTRFHQTLGIIKQFISGYQHSGYAQSWDTGILICPYCRRRDFMPYWEFVDFGFRNDNTEWTSTVEPDKDINQVGFNRNAFGYQVFSRVRCNSATTCGDCFTTVTGHYSSCRSCSSSSVSRVGCGREFAHQSVVKEFTRSEHQNINRRAELADRRVMEVRGGNLRPAYGIRPFFYRAYNAGPVPQGVVINQPAEAFAYIPYLEVGYESIQSGERRPYGYKCPDPDCEFERYAPLNGAEYDLPDSRVRGYDDETKTYAGSDSTGPYPTFNQNGTEANGGLINNMGNCPRHPTLALVPRVSLKPMLSSDAYEPGGRPKNANATARRRGYRYDSWSVDTGRGLTYADQKGIAEVMEATAEQMARYVNAKPVRYPFSGLHRMFVNVPKEVCMICVDKNGYSTENDEFFYSARRGWTLACQNCGSTDVTERRPHSLGISDTPVMYQIRNEQPVERESSPLGGHPTEALFPILLDCPQVPEKSLRQECLQLWAGIPYPAQPEGAPPTGNGIFLCPNDEKYESATSERVRAARLAEEASGITANEDEENLIDTVLVNFDGDSPEPGLTMQEYFDQQQSLGEIPQFIRRNSRIQYDPDSISGDFVTITSPHLLKYRPIDVQTNLPGRPWSLTVRTENIMIAQSEDSSLGVTAPGYSYIVTEGRSRECFRHSTRPRWEDASPEVVTYHNRDSPDSPLSTPRQYARWTQTPEWDIRPPRDGEGFEGNYITSEGDYLWNTETHMAQDRYRVNNYLKVFMPPTTDVTPQLASKYHDFAETGEPMISVETGQITMVYECRTCRDIWTIGNEMVGTGTYEPGAATREYYRRKGLIDADGITTNPDYFPQEVFESALEREADQISNLGVEDSILQRMGRGDGRTAKEMLESPKLVVETE